MLLEGLGGVLKLEQACVSELLGGSQVLERLVRGVFGGWFGGGAPAVVRRCIVIWCYSIWLLLLVLVQARIDQFEVVHVLNVAFGQA